MLQAILLSSSLLLILSMCVSLKWLASARVRQLAEVAAVQAPEPDA